ncbi:cryptochrome 5 [Stylonychia lemnae]|uniref:Cryptochrome 5 n=1 Tax=Stylonychia lemnae TaxID=5949 RepID=A0A078AAU7_STYLE|nr:cryptochrome 5 [Stylonychia lemnae]|eukprot:CDW77913.1 cryptochrome 5 [Stylonychia lemnae]
METISKKFTIYWFRKCQRIHDNKGLLDSSIQKNLLPIFILDPWFIKSDKTGTNRIKFLLESLSDLNANLKTYNSNLIILYGNPSDIFEKLAKHSENLYFELDTEPYALDRDRKVQKICEKEGVQVHRNAGHTLLKLADLAQAGESCKNMGDFLQFIKESMIDKPLEKPDDLPSLPADYEKILKSLKIEYSNQVPSLSEIDRNENEATASLKGGETEALNIMNDYLKDKKKVNNFSKPFTSPNSLKPSTTTLSPYLKFGCLSPRLFYHNLKKVMDRNATQPPVSLVGQLFWREFFYSKSYTVKNFDKMVGNPICKQMNWERNEEIIRKWEMGQTGFPAIDAVMNQLRQEGWMHHLGRHLVACFLTRGHLYQHWEAGRDVFDKYLLDADYALNNANWMWLSCSSFFSQYWKVYSPISFFQKTDKNGDFIRKYVPQLKHYPAEFIYEPHKAPIMVQKRCKCIIGEDYPLPIIDYKKEGAINMQRMKQVFADSKDQSIKEEKKSISVTPKKGKVVKEESKSNTKTIKDFMSDKNQVKKAAEEWALGEDQNIQNDKKAIHSNQNLSSKSRKKSLKQ